MKKAIKIIFIVLIFGVIGVAIYFANANKKSSAIAKKIGISNSDFKSFVKEIKEGYKNNWLENSRSYWSLTGGAKITLGPKCLKENMSGKCKENADYSEYNGKKYKLGSTVFTVDDNLGNWLYNQQFVLDENRDFETILNSWVEKQWKERGQTEWRTMNNEYLNTKLSELGLTQASDLGQEVLNLSLKYKLF